MANTHDGPHVRAVAGDDKRSMFAPAESFQRDICIALETELNVDKASDMKIPSNLDELFNAVKARLTAFLLSAKQDLQESQVDRFIQLHDILEALNGWEDDVKPTGYTETTSEPARAVLLRPLSSLDVDHAIMGPLLKGLRGRLARMLWCQEYLEAHWKNSSDR